MHYKRISGGLSSGLAHFECCAWILGILNRLCFSYHVSSLKSGLLYLAECVMGQMGKHQKIQDAMASKYSRIIQAS